MKFIVKLLLMVFLLFTFSTPSHATSPLPALIPTDIVIDVGHGGIDSGTHREPFYEKNINLQIGKRLYHHLQAAGYRVVLNRDRDYALSDDNHWLKSSSRHRRDLAQRAGLSQLLQPKMMISLHVNWSGNKNKRGAYVLFQRNQQSFLLAESLQHSLNHVHKVIHLPEVGHQYYVLNHAKCPTIIVEMGFLSNATDRAFLTHPSHQKKLVKAMTSAIDHYFSIVE